MGINGLIIFTILASLVFKCARAIFLSEHDLSYLVESKVQKVFFDTGCTDVFLKSAAKLGVDIKKEISSIVLSHGLWEHGSGLPNLEGERLITHPIVNKNNQPDFVPDDSAICIRNSIFHR